MQTLEDLVTETVKNFVQNSKLFTALDISNEVKKTMPEARHRKIRDLVHNAFSTEVEPNGWCRSNIQVNLPDGTQGTALLYYPLSVSYDLDNLYTNRSETSARPTKAVLPAQVTDDGTVVIDKCGTPNPLPTPPTNAKDLWANMFQSQPSLFPLK